MKMRSRNRSKKEVKIEVKNNNHLMKTDLWK